MGRMREILDRVLAYHRTRPQHDHRVLPYSHDEAVQIEPIIEEIRTALFAGIAQRERLERLYREAGISDEWRELYAKIDPGLYALYQTLASVGFGFTFLVDLERQEEEAQRQEKTDDKA